MGRRNAQIFKNVGQIRMIAGAAARKLGAKSLKPSQVALRKWFLKHRNGVRLPKRFQWKHRISDSYGKGYGYQRDG
jgi:asparagine synthetase B (glutamine-hydrolysing)